MTHYVLTRFLQESFSFLHAIIEQNFWWFCRWHQGNSNNTNIIWISLDDIPVSQKKNKNLAFIHFQFQLFHRSVSVSISKIRIFPGLTVQRCVLQVSFPVDLLLWGSNKSTGKDIDKTHLCAVYLCINLTSIIIFICSTFYIKFLFKILWENGKKKTFWKALTCT